jgi:hypothetical protein
MPTSSFHAVRKASQKCVLIFEHGSDAFMEPSHLPLVLMLLFFHFPHQWPDILLDVLGSCNAFLDFGFRLALGFLERAGDQVVRFFHAFVACDHVLVDRSKALGGIVDGFLQLTIGDRLLRGAGTTSWTN